MQLVYGFLLSLILEVYIHRVPSNKRIVQVMVVYVCIALVLILLLWYGIPKLILWYQQITIDIPSLFLLVKEWIPDDWLLSVPSMVVEKTSSMMASIKQLGFIFTCSIFISFDLESITKYIKLDINFIKTADSIIFQYTKGVLLDLILLYLVFGILLFIFQFPESFIVAAILALSNLFPIFGPLFGFVVFVLLCLMTYPQFPFMLVILVFVFQQIESNWIQPFIFKKVMYLKPIVTLISLFICGSLFGIFGMLFSPIIAGVVQLIIRSFVFSKRNKTVGSWEDVWYNFED
ncbi:MAG: AI-2E family transporter [Erysipelotrichaceae bacterium]|nr:AI-2E family transporter [Erysipelotrichaceae bacterium]